jgi:TonB family protein
MVQDTLKDISIPSPVGPSASTRTAPKLAELADIPEVRPKAGTSPATRERVREVVKEALKEVAVLSPLKQLVPVPAPLKLAEPPKGPAVLPKRELANAARTKEQVQAAVTRALEEIEIPAPMADSDPLDVVSLPPSASLAPSVYSELKVIRERNDAMAEEQVTERQGASDTDSSDSPPMMQQAAQWEKAFAEYASRVKMVIDRNWHWQGNNNLELRVSVRFRISSDGRASRVAIAKTSGNQVFDRAAIRAVKQLKRLPRFPADIQREFLDVEMDFSKVRAS